MSEAPPITTGPTPRNLLAAAMRRVTDVMIGHPITDELMTQAAVEVTALAEKLEANAGDDKARRGQPDVSNHPQDFFPTSPMVGHANPIAPPIKLWQVEGENGPELRGTVRFGYAYEGPPTCVHGGVIAELFDEVLGSANIVAGRGALTGTLTVKYRRPTPLLADLEIAARWVRQDGRKIYTEATLHHNGELTAEAEGIFITVGAEQMVKIVSSNPKAADPETLNWIEEYGLDPLGSHEPS